MATFAFHITLFRNPFVEYSYVLIMGTTISASKHPMSEAEKDCILHGGTIQEITLSRAEDVQ